MSYTRDPSLSIYNNARPSGATAAEGLSAIKGAWNTSQAALCLTLPEIRLSMVPIASIASNNRPRDRDRNSAAVTGVDTSSTFNSYPGLVTL